MKKKIKAIIIMMYISFVFLPIVDISSSHNSTKIKSAFNLIDCFDLGSGEIIADIQGYPATSSLTCVDYDNDCDMDFFAGMFNKIYLYVNKQGNFKQRFFYELPPPSGNVDIITKGGLTSADFNNDKYIDIVSGGVGGNIRFFKNKGDFSGIPRFDIYDILNVGQSAYGLSSADFDEDGDKDFVVSYADLPFTHSTISIFYNDGAGDFSNKYDAFRFNYGYIFSLDSGDYDNDGDIDLIFSYSETKDHVRVYGIVKMIVNDGNNNFNDEILISKRGSGIPYDPEGRINPKITSADYDEDGDIDLIVGDNSGKAELYMNNGLGNFTSIGVIHDFGSISWGLASEDIDGDDDIDFLIAAEEYDPVGHIFLNAIS